MENNILSEIKKIKELKSKFGLKFTFKQLKVMKGFETIKEEVAIEIIKQLEEYSEIIVKQLMRLGNKSKSYE